VRIVEQFSTFNDKRPIMTSPSIPPNLLVVEDEMVQRMRAVDIVEDAGFKAVEAVNADEALSILESRSDISLLFSDIQMPGTIDGLKLAHAVHDRTERDGRRRRAQGGSHGAAQSCASLRGGLPKKRLSSGLILLGTVKTVPLMPDQDYA
jgi:hypothetical protein